MSEEKKSTSNLVVALVAALVVALALCGWLAKERNDEADSAADARKQVQVLDAEKKANKEATEAASAFVAKVTTYSHEEGQHDFAWVDELQNVEVREQFRTRVRDLQKAIVTSKTSAKGQVVQAAGHVVDETQVEVLAFVDQAITDPSGEVSVEQSTVNMTMKLIDGEWKVDTLTFLNAVKS